MFSNAFCSDFTHRSGVSLAVFELVNTGWVAGDPFGFCRWSFHAQSQQEKVKKWKSPGSIKNWKLAP